MDLNRIFINHNKIIMFCFNFFFYGLNKRKTLLSADRGLPSPTPLFAIAKLVP